MVVRLTKRSELPLAHFFWRVHFRSLVRQRRKGIFESGNWQFFGAPFRSSRSFLRRSCCSTSISPQPLG